MSIDYNLAAILQSYKRLQLSEKWQPSTRVAATAEGKANLKQVANIISGFLIRKIFFT